jgi:hypothetical protein
MRVKTLKIKTASNNDVKEIQNLFAQMTGASDADRDVLIPKITTIYKNIISYSKLFNILLSFEPFTTQFEEYNFWFTDISTFLKDLVSSTETDIRKNYATDTTINYYQMENTELNTFYKKLKDNEFLKKIIITSSNLSGYKKNLTGDEYDDVFIKREPGLVLQPLAFSSLDLKTIWSVDNLSKKAKTFVLSILSKAYTIGIEIYDIFTSPDVDIKRFSKVLIDSISQLKKKIPRCEHAFAVIENSVSMLEENFKGYFRGSVEAGNPSIIIESFIIDLTNTQKANPKVTQEFRQIVKFLKEKTEKNTDPKVKKLFSMLNTQFSAMDTELGIKPVTIVPRDDDISSKESQEPQGPQETKVESQTSEQVHHSIQQEQNKIIDVQDALEKAILE